MSVTLPLVIANWKLNPQTSGAAKALFLSVRKKIKKDLPVTVVVAPPLLFIADVVRLSPSLKIQVAAQNLFFEDAGAFTGEVSAPMLVSLGVSYVILGHSERRRMGETDVDVNKKILAALRRKIIPVVCVGEVERDNQGNFFNHLEAQIRSAVSGLTVRQVTQLVIAYEPIWAIGTGKNATPEDVKEMQLFITTVLTKMYDRVVAKRVRIIYGGSVKPDNALALHCGGGMSGFLVGGASLIADDFMKIVKAVSL